MSEDFIGDIRSGDRKRGLLALRDLLAKRMEACPARDLASLSRRLLQVMEELGALDDGDGGESEDGVKRDEEDEFDRRRRAVLSAAGVDGPD